MNYEKYVWTPKKAWKNLMNYRTHTFKSRLCVSQCNNTSLQVLPPSTVKRYIIFNTNIQYCYVEENIVIEWPLLLDTLNSYLLLLLFLFIHENFHFYYPLSYHGAQILVTKFIRVNILYLYFHCMIFDCLCFI